MSVKIQIPEVLQAFTEKTAEIEVNGRTVRTCFANLVIRYPAMKEKVILTTGKLSPIIPVYKNEDLIHRLKPGSRVQDGDVLKVTFFKGP